MKRFLKKHVAKILVLAMVLTTVVGFAPAKAVTGETLPDEKNIEFGVKYSGEVEATLNEEKTAYDIQFFNVADSAFNAEDEFYVSCTFDGAEAFKQIAIQSDVNDWDWAAAPKVWSDTGVTSGTVVAGKIEATVDGENLAFKIQLDNPVENAEIAEPLKITLSDLYIIKLTNAGETSYFLPADKYIGLGVPYSGDVTANINETKDAWEAQYFNVVDTTYTEGDTYVFSYTLEGADGFRQVVTQSSLNNWAWDGSPKLWAGEGLAPSQSFAGAITATGDGEGISFKIRLDSPVPESDTEPGESISLKVTNLIVVKVTDSTVLDLTEPFDISANQYYTGNVEAVLDEDDNSWNIEYFNIDGSEIKEGEQFRVSFIVSGASDFKQVAVLSNANGWDWESAPKIYREEGIQDGTPFSGVITATAPEETEENGPISFKLRFDNPMTEEFNEETVGMTLTNLIVTGITIPEPAPTETPEPEPTETPEPTAEPGNIE